MMGMERLKIGAKIRIKAIKTPSTAKVWPIRNFFHKNKAVIKE